MICQSGHDHSSQDVLVAKFNRTEPHGIRPFHCPGCWQAFRADNVTTNWSHLSLAQAQSEGRTLCRDCF